MLTAISHICWDRVYSLLPAWTSVHSSKPGVYSKKSMNARKKGLPPPKTPVFGGMLRKTGISPYIWWFWGAFGGFLGLCTGMAAVWWYMGGFGGIWCAMVIYRTALYIMVALYICVPNHLLHLLLIASVHIVCLNSAKG